MEIFHNNTHTICRYTFADMIDWMGMTVRALTAFNPQFLILYSKQNVKMRIWQLSFRPTLTLKHYIKLKVIVFGNTQKRDRKLRSDCSEGDISFRASSLPVIRSNFRPVLYTFDRVHCVSIETILWDTSLALIVSSCSVTRESNNGSQDHDDRTVRRRAFWVVVCVAACESPACGNTRPKSQRRF